MFKFEPLPEDILNRIDQAAAALESHPRVVFAYLFGGPARESRSPLSDVDIAVYLEETADFAEGKLDLLGCLMETLGTDEIDLVVLNTAPLSLKGRILQNKRLLADKKPFRRHEFESLTLREYFDFVIKEKTVLKRRYDDSFTVLKEARIINEGLEEVMKNMANRLILSTAESPRFRGLSF